jgi:anti-sigma factor RsiW
MQCRKVKKNLSRYQAGECPSSEAQALERHLASCPACSAELEELRQLDRRLDLWQVEPVPEDFWVSVLAKVADAEVKRNEAKTTVPNLSSPQTRTSVNGRSKWSENCQPLLPLLRDLVAAAAVTLVLFWNTGAWMEGGQTLAAGKGLTGIMERYSQLTGQVWEQAAETAEEYTQKIFWREE